jgi:hypothetical protein
MDTFTLFPGSLFGLDALVLGAWLGIFESAHLYTLQQGSHEQLIGNTNT